MTTFHQNRSMMKGRSASQRHTDKPVGFYGPIAPPVPNAPSSRICGQNPRYDAAATFLDPHICHRLPVYAARPTASTAAARYDRREVTGMANFKMYREFLAIFWVLHF